MENNEWLLCPVCQSKTRIRIRTDTTVSYTHLLPYAVSKAAVHCLTKSLARALAPDIRVNCIAPAAISTRWWVGEEEKMYRLSGNLPLQRVSTPEDIAELICSLLIQPSMTGQVISPNNGMLI